MQRGGCDHDPGQADHRRRRPASRRGFVDLKGRTVLPGFIDPHAHMLTFAMDCVEVARVAKTAEGLERLTGNPPMEVFSVVVCDSSPRHITTLKHDPTESLPYPSKKNALGRVVCGKGNFSALTTPPPQVTLTP
ncbi:MAG: amidohydrolase family protein [Verrucomicrobiales bacterium]